MKTRRQAHAVYKCEYHIVLMTRYRRHILRGGVKSYMNSKLIAVRRFYPEIEFIEYNVQSDHVHLVLSFPPKYSPGKIIRIIKENTAKALRAKFAFLNYVYYGRGGIWSAGYFISTVGLDEETIQKYVRYQQREDLGQAIRLEAK